MSLFKVKKANNMPIQSPLIPDPFVPYSCNENKTLLVYCQTSEEVVKRYLEPTPFEYVSNNFAVSISDFSNCDRVSFMDCAIVFQVKYKNILGGYYMFEYENNDSAIAAGRELWGYPKKYADISLVREGNKVIGEATRDNLDIIRIECDLSKESPDLQELNLVPHLNIHTIPKPDGKGVFSKRVIARDTTPDFILYEEMTGEATIKLKRASDPLDEFNPVKILGGKYMIGDFYATEENGWGKTVDTLV